MITLHHLNNSLSQRVLWLLEELCLDYEVAFYTRDKETLRAPPELNVIHSLGKAPVLTDEQLVIAESGAIIEYLVRKYDSGSLRPESGSEAELNYIYYLHYAEGSLMSFLLMSLVFSRLSLPPMPLLLRPFASMIGKGMSDHYLSPQLQKNFEFINIHLSKHDWFAGNDFSAADIQMSFPLEAAHSRKMLGDQYPNIEVFLTKIHARDAYQAALAKGGPYDYVS